MLNKDEVRDGPFLVTLVPKKDVKNITMSPLDYVGLSGLKETEYIRIGKVKDFARVSQNGVSVDIDKEYDVVDLADIDKTIGEIANIKQIKGEEIDSLKSQFCKGDIIFGKLRPYNNNVAIVDEIPKHQDYFIGSSEWIRIKPKKLPHYLFLALRSRFTLFQTSASKGSVRPRFNPNKIPYIEIPKLKDNSLMLKIDKVTKQIFKIRGVCNNVIQELLRYYENLCHIKTTKETLLTKAFPREINKNRMDGNYYILLNLQKELRGMDSCLLKKIASFSNEKIHSLYQPRDPIQYITTSDVDPNQGEIVYWEEKVYKPSEPVTNKAPDRAQMVLHGNQILLPHLKLSLNSVAWVPSDLDGYIGSNGFAVLKTKNIDYGFLYIAMRSRIVQDQLELIAGGTIMEDISKDGVENILIYIPKKSDYSTISKKAKLALELRWKARKQYLELMESFENFCSSFIDKKLFIERLANVKENINNLLKNRF